RLWCVSRVHRDRVRARDGGCSRALGARRRKVREQAMGAKRATYRTRDLTQAIVGVRRAGLVVRRIEIDREGKITVHISGGLTDQRAGEGNGGINECDAVLDRIEKRQAKEGG